jgi:hypothetical protein
MAEQWHTYREVAQALGIQVQSVRKRRQRYGWQSRTNNQSGKTEVLVDLEILLDRKDPDEAPVTEAKSDELVELKLELATLTERNAQYETRIAEQVSRIEKLEADQGEKAEQIRTLLRMLEEGGSQRSSGWLARLLGR